MMVLIEGRIVQLDGVQPIESFVVIESDPRVLTDSAGNIIFTSPVKRIVDSAGRFYFEVPATDDPDVVETFDYTMKVHVNGVQVNESNFLLPQAAPVVDAADLIAV